MLTYEFAISSLVRQGKQDTHQILVRSNAEGGRPELHNYRPMATCTAVVDAEMILNALEHTYAKKGA